MVMSLLVISVVVAVGCDFLLVVTVVVLLVVIDGDFSGGCDCCLSVVEDLWRWWFTALLYVNVIAETNLSLHNHTCLAHTKDVK